MRYFCLVTLFAFLYCSGWAQQYDPMANPQAVVLAGKARFTVLTNHVIRMEYSDSSAFTDLASLTFVNRNLPVPDFKKTEDKGWLVIQIQFYTLHYKENSGPFTSKNLYIEYKDPQHTFTWKPGMKDKKNLKGTTRTLDGVSGKFNYYGMRKIKLEDGILSRSGWCFIDDSQKPLFDNSDWPWVESRDSGRIAALKVKYGDAYVKATGQLNDRYQDFYFFGYGSNYKDALYDFTQVAGKISMPPKFAFGVWYSRYWAYTEAQFKEIVADYKRYNIPLDVLVIDMDWHLTEQSSPEIFAKYNPKPNGWTGFTWEKKYFPDYKEFLAWTDSMKIQTCMNIHPAAGVQPHEAAYPAFAKAMGVDTAGHPTIPFDITNKKFAQNYFNVLLHPYEKAGVDFWWLDWQQWGNTGIKGVNPTFYLNYVHFSDMQRQGKRPLIFHRWGGLGNHRYEIGFSGDYFINWKGLNYQPEFTANAANVGFGYWSHDIGGHMSPLPGTKKNKQDPELYTRWVEWGAFSPIFRTHATKDSAIERRMWKYPEANLNAMRRALQMRYALLPYIYTMARLAYDSGISIIRPMYYEFPDMELAYHLNHQYYFGNNLIVAPITNPMKGKQTIEQSVWLPKGDWFDYYTNKMVQGGQVVKRGYALDEIPIYVKAGSIIPMQTAKLRITGSVMDTVILRVYYSISGSFDMYEDDGTTDNYRNNIYAYTHFDYKQESGDMQLSVHPDAAKFDGQVAERAYRFEVVNINQPQQVTLDGKMLVLNKDWAYDAAKSVLTITTPRRSTGDGFAVEVKEGR